MGTPHLKRPIPRPTNGDECFAGYGKVEVDKAGDVIVQHLSHLRVETSRPRQEQRNCGRWPSVRQAGRAKVEGYWRLDYISPEYCRAQAGWPDSGLTLAARRPARTRSRARPPRPSRAGGNKDRPSESPLRIAVATRIALQVRAELRSRHGEPLGEGRAKEMAGSERRPCGAGPGPGVCRLSAQRLRGTVRGT